MELGYKLCSEENSAGALVRQAEMAENSGFSFGMISDHYHPWTVKQSHSPFVWATLGGVSVATHRLCLVTGVTCPIQRIHPAIIAQAAATVATMLPGRFVLGLGTGENLNEHIFGDRWPPADIRQEMLQEAVEVIRLLWRGEETDYHGVYFSVENARLFDLPSSAPPICIAAAGAKSAALAGKIGDGLISTAPDEEVMKEFRGAGGAGPAYAEMSVCYSTKKDDAIDAAYENWPNVALVGELMQVLPVPAHFEQATALVSKEDVASKVVCGPDPEPYLEGIKKYLDAGFDHIALHQIGDASCQQGFFDFFKKELQPRLEKMV